MSLCCALVISAGDGAGIAPSPAELTTANKGVSADKHIVCVVIYQSIKLKFHRDVRYVAKKATIVTLQSVTATFASAL